MKTRDSAWLSRQVLKLRAVAAVLALLLVGSLVICWNSFAANDVRIGSVMLLAACSILMLFSQALVRSFDFASFLPNSTSTTVQRLPLPLAIQQEQSAPEILTLPGSMAWHFLDILATGRRRSLLVLTRDKLALLPGRHAAFSEFNFALEFWHLCLIPLLLPVYLAIAGLLALCGRIDQKKLDRIHSQQAIDSSDFEKGVLPISLAEEPIVSHDRESRRIYLRLNQEPFCRSFQYPADQSEFAAKLVNHYAARVQIAIDNASVVPCGNCDHPMFEGGAYCSYCGMESNAQSEWPDHFFLRMRLGDQLPAICFRCATTTDRAAALYEPYSALVMRIKRQEAGLLSGCLLATIAAIPIVGWAVVLLGKLLSRKVSHAIRDRQGIEKKLAEAHRYSVLPQCDLCLTQHGLPAQHGEDENCFLVHRCFGKHVIAQNRSHSKSVKLL